MSDLIDRQMAIDTEGLDEQIRCEMCRNPIHTDRGCDGNCKYDEKLYERIMQILSERITPLPSAQRKTGKWILSDDRNWKTCSECGADVDVSMGLGIFVDNDEVSEMCFCPNCGADMRGESDEML